jgi:anti-anti-sigma factor
MSSTAFAVLFTTARMVEGKNGRLALCGLSPDVLVGARIIGLERAAPIFDDVKTARGNF